MPQTLLNKQIKKHFSSLNINPKLAKILFFSFLLYRLDVYDTYKKNQRMKENILSDINNLENNPLYRAVLKIN